MLTSNLIDYSKLPECKVLELLQNDPTLIIDRIPQTEERCIVALQKSGYLLRFVSKKNQTLEMCLAAVSNYGMALVYVSRRLMCRDLYVAAVNRDGQAIIYVPAAELDDELIHAAIQSDSRVIKYLPRHAPRYTIPFEFIKEAISRDGMVLEYLEEKKCCAELCNIAVDQNPLALMYVPESMKTEVLCHSAFQRNPQAIAYIPEQFLTERICTDALHYNPLLLRFVPDMYKKKETCRLILQRAYNTIPYIPSKYLELSDYVEALKKYVQCICNESKDTTQQQSKIATIVSAWPPNITEHYDVISICHKFGLLEIITKKYDIAQNVFVVDEKYATWCSEIMHREFHSFHAFYVYLNSDLNGANLYDYDFEGINLDAYKIEGAYIKSDILIKHNLYDPSFYERTVLYKNSLVGVLEAHNSKDLAPEAVLHESDLGGIDLRSNRKLYYISDIHINQKIHQAFPNYATSLEIRYFIEQIAQKILDSAPDRDITDYLLIAGDTSYSFEICQIFYTYLAQNWRNIIVVLGNHELWDCGTNHRIEQREQCINRYRNMFSKLGIVFLHNDLLIVDSDEQRHIIASSELEKLTCQDLETLRTNLFKGSRMAVLGSLGYSGYNSCYNASSGLYKHAVVSIDEDIQETKKFEHIYSKLYSSVQDYPLVILTHTPKEDWSHMGYNKNWIYINGHTHKNQFFCDENKTVYSDNQIGYHGLNSIDLKFFQLSKQINIFWDYPNGIHTITREQYLAFNRGMQIKAKFIRTNGKFYMLKSEDIYCFIYEDKKGKHLLDGGNLKALAHNDLEYYYSKLPYYAAMVKSTFQQYYLLLGMISQEVKKFGGSGTIHGSIVDISFLSHLYLDPERLTITPYHAYSKSIRNTYPSVEALLHDHYEIMYQNYVSLQKHNPDAVKLLETLNSSPNNALAKYESHTEMYRLSELVRKAQYIIEQNVIRIWDETIFDSANPSIGGVTLIEAGK